MNNNRKGEIEMKKSRLLGVVCVYLMFVSGFSPLASNAASVTIGPTDSGADCTFACMVRWQQGYDSSSFSEAININTVNFFATGVSSSNATFDFYFSYMNGDYTSITTDFNNNIGSNYQLFESKVFSQTFLGGDIISFNGSFMYDPLLGDLLIDVVRHSETSTESLGNSGLMASSDGLPLSRAYQWPINHDGGAYSAVGFGLSTQFVESSVVPIPSAVWPFGSGLIGLIGLAKRKGNA